MATLAVAALLAGRSAADPELPGVDRSSRASMAAGDAAELESKSKGHTAKRTAQQRQLPAGRTWVEVEIPKARYLSIGVFGSRHALLGFDVVGGEAAALIRAQRAFDEDGLLPRVVSLPPLTRAAKVWVVVDASEPVQLFWAEADPAAIDPPPTKRASDVPPFARALVGFPVPEGPSMGYFLQAPGRYQFVRVDVANIVRAALKKTEQRFRGGPIALADISQWNGDRPATDLGHPRHISHVGGRDIDFALPANDGIPSTVRDHCRGVLVEPERYGCAPGTVRGLDAMRMAFLLGEMVDQSPEGLITKVYIDEAYRAEVQRQIPALRERRWLSERGEFALGEEGILVASPWHTDHFHVRFGGEPAESAFP